MGPRRVSEVLVTYRQCSFCLGFCCGLDVERDDTSPAAGRCERFITHIRKLSGDNRVGSQASSKMILREKRD